MKKTIIPAIIANSQKELNERLNKIKNISRIFHLDVMDGKFVKNKSLMFDFKVPRLKRYQAHLMVKNPKNWINKNWKKVNTIIFHEEVFKKRKGVEELIGFIKKKKRKVGLALNPKTSVEKISPYLSKIDLVLVMSVNPGKYGGKFLPKTLEKINQIKKINPSIKIEIDGGISDKTINGVCSAGGDIFISGSYLQKSQDSKKALRTLLSIVQH